MQHYLVEIKSNSALFSAYPHTPNDVALSTQDYLEDMFSQDWELVSFREDANGQAFAFRTIGR